MGCRVYQHFKMPGINSLVYIALLSTVCSLKTDEDEAKIFIEEVYRKGEENYKKLVAKEWEYETMDFDRRATDDERVESELNAVQEELRKEKNDLYKEFKEYDWTTFSDSVLKRKFEVISDFKNDVLSTEERQRLEKIEEGMEYLDFSDGFYTLKPLNPDGDVEEHRVGVSTKYDLYSRLDKEYKDIAMVNHFWKEVQDKVTNLEKDWPYKWMPLKTKTAQLNGHESISEYWQSQDNGFQYRNVMNKLFTAIEPYFKRVHAYLRHKLRQVFPDIKSNAPIPASLLTWEHDYVEFPEHVMELIKPVSDKKYKNNDRGFSLKKGPQDYEAVAKVKRIDEYFQSWGFDPLPEKFYSKSFLTNDHKRTTLLWKVYDFGDGEDIRIMASMEHPSEYMYYNTLERVFEVQWKLAFKDQPFFFRKMPFFYVGVKEAFVKLHNSFKSLKEEKLMEEDFELDENMKINLLFEEFLIKGVFQLPLDLALIEWQNHFLEVENNGRTNNCEYWRLRNKYQGVEPPVDRENSDFDAAAYPENMIYPQFADEFFSTFVRYDVMSSLCKAGGNDSGKDGLAYCNISNKKKAGSKLKEAMKLGASVPWPEVLEKITGRKEVDASGLIEYFKPLFDWIEKYNIDNNVEEGWTEEPIKCHEEDGTKE